MLGIFDSGLGGLTVLRRIREIARDVDVLYFADQAHVPYGDRTEDDLVALLAANVEAMEKLGASTIVMGCNTSCAVAAKRGWPVAGVPILDLIRTAAAGVGRTGAKRIGVVATAATAKSGAYGDALRREIAGAEVFEIGAPALVPLVEAGHRTGAVVDAAVAGACAQLPSQLDAVILACTHYPLIDASFAAALGPAVARIDPAIVQAEHASGYIAGRGTGRTEFVTTGAVEPFRAEVEAILGGPVAGAIYRGGPVAT